MSDKVQRSNQHEPLAMPQGQIRYTEGNASVSANMMSTFCSAADILIEQWRQYDAKARTLPDGIEHTDATIRCEHLVTTLVTMLHTVKQLGITPLEIWLTARLEQEDM